MKTFLDFFSPSVFPDDEEKTRSAYYLNAITLISIFVITLLLVLRLVSGTNLVSTPNLIFSGIIFILIIVFFLGKNGRILSAGYLNIATLWVATTLLAIGGNGTAGNQAARYIVVIAFAGLILGYRAALWIASISIFSIFGTVYAESIGIVHQQIESSFIKAIQASIPLILSAVFIYLSINSLQAALKKVKMEAQEVEKNNKELKELHESLEDMVKERTDNLLKANIENQRRAAQFLTVAQIAQTIASERDLNTLLSIITDVISAQFNYYHIGIYLNDDIQEYTILSAANSEDGKHMMQHGHKLPIGQTSVVGYVAMIGKARSTAEADDLSLNDLNLPETKSELALPLKVGTQTIGVIDMQSKEENAFDQTDTEVLTALANQVTIAIQNTRLFAETQTALAESQLLYGTVVKQAWQTNIQTNPQVGYRYAGIKSTQLEKEISTPEIRAAMENNDLAVTHPSRRKSENALAIPIKMRESTIGVLNINFPIDVELEEDEIDIARAASQQIAIALENASLLEESQRRAKREQTISEISTKISSKTEIEAILKTVIRELGVQIGGAQITVEMGSENE